jgi:hypothetical protein
MRLRSSYSFCKLNLPWLCSRACLPRLPKTAENQQPQARLDFSSSATSHILFSSHPSQDSPLLSNLAFHSLFLYSLHSISKVSLFYTLNTTNHEIPFAQPLQVSVSGFVSFSPPSMYRMTAAPQSTAMQISTGWMSQCLTATCRDKVQIQISILSPCFPRKNSFDKITIDKPR